MTYMSFLHVVALGASLFKFMDKSDICGWLSRGLGDRTVVY